MCWPQPAHVVLPQVWQVTARHTGDSSRRSTHEYSEEADLVGGDRAHLGRSVHHRHYRATDILWRERKTLANPP